MFQEFPKALYLAGQQLVVDDEHQEVMARESGYDDWQADHKRTTGEPEEVELDRDALKAEAIGLGLTFANNIKTEKLAELVAAHKQ